VADLSLVFDLLARDRASQPVRQVGDEMRRTGDQADKFGGLMKKGMGLVAGAFAVSAVTDTLTGLYDAAAESAKVTKLTENVIRSTGQAAGLTADQVGNLAAKLSQQTGIDDEAVQGAENLLLTFTNVKDAAGAGNDVFSQTTALALDMSTALGKDASSSAMQLGKALNDPIKGVSALGRSGVSFTKQQKDQIKTLVNSGKTLDAQKIILAEVGKEFGGAAEAAATPMDKLKVTAGNLQEQIGTGLIPVFDKLAGGASQAIGILFSGDYTGGPFAEDSGVVNALFSIRDAATKVGDYVRDTLLPKVSELFQTLEDHKTTVTVIAGLITGTLAAAFTVWGTRATIAAAQNTVAWFTTAMAARGGAAAQQKSAMQVVVGWMLMGARAVLQGIKIAAVWTAQIVASAVSGAASFAVQVARVVAGWALMAAQATLNGIRVAAVWTAQIVASAVSGAASMAVQVARVVAGWVLMGVQSLLQAARMAAAWFIALGPVGWVIAAVVGIVALVIANWDKVSSFTARAWHAVVDWIVGAWNSIKSFVVNAAKAVVGFIVNAWNGVKAKTTAAWNAVKNAVTRGVGAAIDFVKGMPGKIAGNLGNLGKTLYSKGRDLIDGLINGAKSLLSNIGRMFLDVVPGWIRGPFESALGISSPSKVFHGYGVNITQGLINGLSGTASNVVSAVKDMAKQIKGAKVSAAVKAATLRLINARDNDLVRLAKQRDAVAKQLEKARDRLDAAVKLRTDFAVSVRDAARQFADVTSIKTGGSAAVLVDDLRTRLNAITTFRSNLAKLAKLGLTDSAYQQIASAGVEQGNATAQALLSGGKGAVQQVNALQAQIAKASSGLGNDAAGRLYQAGVDAAAGLVEGLSAQSRKLTKAADKLADQLTAAVKRKLGIRSPSKVFEGIGANIGQGLADGIAGMQPAVAAQLAALADTQAVTGLQTALAAPAPAGGLGYRAPRYDTAGVAAAPAAGATYTTTVSGVASPEQVAAVVARAQRTTEFLAGAGT
jgi:Prophage tail length tape measure protein